MMAILVKRFEITYLDQSVPYQTHVSLADIEQLGKFVDTRFPQKFSHASNPWINTTRRNDNKRSPQQADGVFSGRLITLLKR